MKLSKIYWLSEATKDMELIRYNYMLQGVKKYTA